jgi:hypothetical protein
MFLDKMIDSTRNFFLKNHQREFYIVTDEKDFKNASSSDVKVFLQERKGWPEDCLLRSRYIIDIASETETCDYLYFFGANLVVMQEIDEDVLPDESGLAVVEHAWNVHRDNKRYAYDRNPKSKAYIPMGEGKIYYQAIFWGGSRIKFLEMSETIAENTDEDIRNKVEAVWLDESHLNKYLYDNPPKTLSPYYAWPQMIQISPELSKEIKILQLEKRNYLSGNFRYINK